MGRWGGGGEWEGVGVWGGVRRGRGEGRGRLGWVGEGGQLLDRGVRLGLVGVWVSCSCDDVAAIDRNYLVLVVTVVVSVYITTLCP